MAMSVGSSGGEDELNSTINTTPLVDVMLVLLIIFLITIPVINKTVKVSLPKAANIATQTKPENITVAVDSLGNIYWNNEPVADRDQLIEMIKLEAIKDPQPEIHIRGDSNARFADIGKIIYSVQRGGIVKVGFITEPDRGIRGSR
ncbi:MAG: biopolymer transporter ExbD [Gammaproteobacteria bacterium]|nr:biopolymer transporter ExbD [Gammaproteobacteria bacterium]